MTEPTASARQRPVPQHCTSQTLERIGVSHTDMMGIVHHSHYVVFFERGRLEYMRRRGLSYKEFVGRGLHMPVIELNVRYRKPAVFDDELHVETRLGGLTRATVRFEYAVRRAAAAGAGPELLLEASVQLACVNDGQRPRGLPADVVQLLLAPERAHS